MLLIGLAHRARAGKDAVAEHLVKSHGFTRYALADILKESVNLVTGWDTEHAYGYLKEVVDPYWNCSPRYAYQRIGTEGYRKLIGEDVWAKALRLRIESDAARLPDPDSHRAVIADVRFKAGEVEMVKSMGGHLWRIDRPGLVPLVVPPEGNLARLWHKATGKDKTWSHQSECDLLDFTGWDSIIKNDGTLSDLYAKVTVEINQITGDK